LRLAAFTFITSQLAGAYAPTPLRSSSGRPRAGPSARYPYPSPGVALDPSQLPGARGYVGPL